MIKRIRTQFKIWKIQRGIKKGEFSKEDVVKAVASVIIKEAIIDEMKNLSLNEPKGSITKEDKGELR